MLFSNDEIAAYINQHFEAVWQSMRPVPTVRVDFGNGRVVTRTLHGNIATYSCSAEGQIYDILPGLYQPATYLEQLQQMQRLAQYVGKSDDRYREYHIRQAAALRRHGRPELLIGVGGGVSITGRELGIEYVLQPAKRLQVRGKAARKGAPVGKIQSVVDARDESPESLLQMDTQINETIRRRLIHERLALAPRAQPADIEKWLYREVLKADLDDPYLGLGNMLRVETQAESPLRTRGTDRY